MTAAYPVLFAQAVLQADAAGTDIEDVAVRIGRLENTDTAPVILLEDAGWLREPSINVFLPARVSVTAYGKTEYEAMVLLRAATDILHAIRNRVIDGVGCWKGSDETGPQPRDEPNARWPARFTVVALYMPDVALSMVS